MKNKFLQFLSSMRRGAAMLLLLLTCVTHAWADSTVKGGDVYFDAGGSGWSVDNVQFVIGHGSYSNRSYSMTAVQNTLLYYYSSPSWNDATYFAFASGTSSWSDDGQPKWSSRCEWATKSTTEKGSYTLNSGNAYVFKSNGTDKCESVESDSPYGWQGDSYTSLNKTITVAAKVSTDGGANYSSASSPGTLTASSYSFTNHGNNCKNSTSLSDGEIICGYTANTTLTAGSATGYTIDGWYDSNGDKLCNNGGTINPREDATVYAYYKLNQYTVSYGVNSSTRNGSITLNSGSSVSTTSSSTLNHGTSISFTASPNSGYQVEGWYSDAACSSNKKIQSGGTSYNAGTLTADITVYVKFEVRTGGTVTLTAGTGGQVSLDNSNWGASKAKSEITTATAFNIYAQASTGYTFSAWAKSSGSGTITSTSSASTSFTPVAYEDATVTASFTQNMSSLTTSNHYDVGNPSYSVPSKSVSSIGIATTADLTAASPGTGYQFAGWTLSNNIVVESGDKDEDLSITIRTNGNGAAATAQANYEEVLTSTYYLVGNNTSVFPGPSTWTADNANMLRKASGSSTGNVGSITINVKSIPANSSDYLFKIHESTGNKWYGWSNETYYWMDDTKTTSLYNNQHDLYFIPNALGDYTFSVNWGGSDPSLTVTFPATTYTVNFGQGSGTAGSASATYSSTSFSSGTKVQNGKEITLTAPSASSGYSWDGWYNASSGGTRVSTNSTLTTTVSSTNHDFYARYTEATYTVAFNDGDHGTVSPSGDQQVGAGGKDIEATPSPGYMFTSWSKTGNDVTLSSTSTNPTTVTAAGTGSVTANYEQRFVLRGSTRAADATTAGMAGWDATDNDDYTSFSVAGNVITIEASLEASTEYKFKIWDKYGSGAWRGQTGSGSMSDGDSWGFNGSNDVFFTTTFAGTYTFDIDVSTATTPSVTITYPLSHTLTYSIGSVSGTEGSIATSPSTASGSLVEDGHSVTLTAPAAKTGYQWKGWYTNAAGTEGKIPDDTRAITLTMDDDYTVYACYEAKTYTVTLDHEGGTSGPSNPTVTYDAKPTDLLSIPTKAGYGFDGYWTEDDGNGIQVIDGTGKWLKDVAYNTDGSGNWIHDGNQTYYAKWLAVGYYVVGGPGMDNWTTDPSKLFSGSPLTLELALNKSSFEGNDPTLTAEFKIRQVKAGASSNDVWFGKGAKDKDVAFGKYSPSQEDLTTSGSNMLLQVYYNGTYTFTISNIDDVNTQIDLALAVPVIDQLQIYSGCDGTKDAYYNWNGAPVDDVVSKTVTLDNCTDPNGFFFKAVFDSEYYGKNSTTLTRDNSSATDLSTSGDNIKIETDVKGDYTFNYNVEDHSISVTYPDKRQVNYSAVTLPRGTGESADPTAENDGDDDEAVANGGYVADGYSVTFRAAAANTGYTFRGWFSKNNPSNWSDGILASTADYTAPISANTTVYAVYSEDDLTVTVQVSATGGSITTPAAPASTVTAHPATGTAIVAARANEAWHFTGWTVESGTAAFGNASALSTTVTASTDATIKANFVPRFGLNGSLVGDDSPGHGMPGWVFGNAADFEVKSFTGLGDAGVCLQCTCTLDPNATYKFRVLDRDINNRRGCSASSEPDNILPAGSNWTLDYTEGDALKGAQDVHIQTVGRGTYIFHITKLSDDGNHYPSLQVERQASHLVSIGQGYQNIDGTITSNSSTGGTMAADATESGITVDITNGKYIANGGKLDFEATPATGYSFEGWHSTSALTSEFATANPSNIASVTAAANVYAKFVENSTAVTIEHNAHGHVTVGGETATSTTVGITTTRALVAVPDDGYYFAGWTVPDGADFELQDKSEDEDAEVTLHGLGAGTAGTLTANFVEEDKIYFRNIDQSTGDKLWDKDHIYVYFGVTWDDQGGMGGVQGPSNYKEMSPYGSTKNYWAYVPHSFTKGGGKKVAFSDVDMHENDEFYGNKGVYRADYSRIASMFVPYHTSSGSNNGTTYYSNGYWKVFDPQEGIGQGYYLQLHTGDDGKGNGTYEQKGEFTAIANGSPKISYTMRVDNTSTQTQYRIVSAGGINYVANTTISSAACTDVTVIENSPCSNCYFTVTPTSEGNYTFIIDQSEDYMKISVDYPVSVGDYRLKNSYNDGSAKSAYSEVIKANDASTPRTLSMYLNTAGSGTLVLQKCTTIVKGVPSWDAGDDENLDGVLETVGSNPGVYQFDVSVSGDKVAEAPTAEKYTGPYYIKTNGASGGWVNYKQNAMTENTLNYDTDHPEKSFNYYYCKYYNASGTNLKCVIANDYNNALTDTLIGDAVIGMGNQTTPSAVSVRFSYNSYTNEIKRSYLGASTSPTFLRVVGNTTASAPHIYDKDETTYDDSHADEYIKFEDKQNWRYEIDIKADVNAHAKLTASFNGETQYFMGHAGTTGHEWDDENTEQLFGGASGTYGLTLVYDFKTNKLIRAWKPTGDAINSDLTLNSDVLLLREHQGAPTAITFGLKDPEDEDSYASLNTVKTVYSVLRLNRWILNNRARSFDTNPDHCNSFDNIDTYHPRLEVNQDDENGKWLPQAERELYFISFPYDVKMSDIIHFGGYYDLWGIMYYDGKGRAQNGFWSDSKSNWKYFTPEEFATKTLNAYEGYLIGIDVDQMWYGNTSFWTNNSSEVDIYFPSKEPVSTITQKSVIVPIDTAGYECKINRTIGGSDGDRRVKDSHWHCIGVPAYADLTHAINNGAPGKEVDWANNSLLYLYEWDTEKNEHTIKKADNYSFQAMYSYLVQYAGIELSWSAAAATGPASIAAKRMKTEELRDRQFDLYLMQGDKEADHTYIRLSDDEEVTTGFEFNHDVSKMMLSGANIYTLIGKEQAAANSLPLSFEQTTVVPVGVQIAADGDYTFAIPEGTEGVGVVLIDNITGTRTNLGLTDYTVNLNEGRNENRFMLEISPIQQTPTDVELLNGANGENGVRKVMIDGLLYIVKDGKVYDARGSRVK